MSYRERRLRKDRRAKTGEQLQRMFPDLRAARGDLDSFRRFDTYEVLPDGSKRLVMRGQVSDDT